MVFSSSGRKVFLLIISIFTLGTVTAQTDNSVSNNINRAYEILRDAYAEMNYNNSVGDLRMQVNGTYYYYGHFETPSTAREYAMSGQMVFNQYGTQLTRRDTFKRAGNTVTSAYQIDGENISVTEADEKIDVSKYDIDKYLYKAAIFNPNLFLQLAIRNASQNSFVSTSSTHHIIRHSNSSGNIYYLFINKETYLLDKVDQPEYDPLKGDYFTTTLFEKYNVKDGYQTPREIVMKKGELPIYKLTVTVKNILPGLEGGSYNLSKKQIGEWTYVINMPQWNTKAGVADMKDFLIVFEAPNSPKACYALIEYIGKNFRNKKIRYCVITHHHPDHMGGVRAFIENGTTIVTTKGNKSLIDNIAINPHVFSEEVRNKKAVKPEYLFITDYRYDIKSDGRQVTVYPYGRNSAHTDEYLISYIPADKLLIEGDLIKAWDIKQRELTEREASLFKYVDEQGMNVEKVLQTWPFENAPSVIEYDKIAPESGSIKKKLFDAIKGK